MALRTYYDTQIKIYHLLYDHPIMHKLLEEFNVDIDNIKAVALFLLENHDEIASTNLQQVYYSELIEQIGELYGFFPPFDDQLSSSGTPLQELLNFTVYLYKFGTTENFYENNILNFLPEYDRDYILSQPKLKLLYEAIGRKLDNIELSISQMKNIYDIDSVPEQLLDYLGQNIGYEKEDYTLKNVSFRELLKNIIEIYKIKGTNYSFSFFFKFLGFEISLKEFFFNRDVKNPEGFPGVELNKVEYYLTTKNPTLDISNNKPAKYLEKTKNINDWALELTSLESKGCTNSIKYMLGFEPYNNILDNPTWHSNPWKYFKTNLIEYELNPFFDKLNLTASDNETIRKYVKFLSPTYLFTWINVNIKPWIEDINIIVDSNDDWLISVIQNLGDPRPTPQPWPFTRKTSADLGFNGFNNDGIYYDYEPCDEVLEIYKNGEKMTFSVSNNMNLGGHENIGTTLKRDGVYIRQPGHPKFISNITHQGDKKISFDFLSLQIRDYINDDIIPQVNYYSDLPSNIPNDTIYYVKYDENDNLLGYYRFNSIISRWDIILWNDYSYRSYPATPVNPVPNSGQTISTNHLTFSWEDIKGNQGYWLQVSTDSNFNTIVVDDNTLTNNNYISSELFSNDRYYWRIKVKNDATFPNLPSDNPINTLDYQWTLWSNRWQFAINALPFPYNGEIINKTTAFVSENRELGLFKTAKFNIKWQDIPGSQQYKIQIMKNKPYVWAIKQGIYYNLDYSTLPTNKPLGTEYYVVDEEKFYIYKSINQDWVEIPQPDSWSVIDKFENLPVSEQKIGDCWYTLDREKFYCWQSTLNQWQENDNMHNVLGNIGTLDQLINMVEELDSVYFVQSLNEFYSYVPAEDVNNYYINMSYDSFVTNNSFAVELENGKYYWRIKSYVGNNQWTEWSNLYEFTINFS